MFKRYFNVAFLLIVKLITINCDQYDIGVGIADITGPAADINMVCYDY